MYFASNASTTAVHAGFASNASTTVAPAAAAAGAAAVETFLGNGSGFALGKEALAGKGGKEGGGGEAGKSGGGGQSKMVFSAADPAVRMLPPRVGDRKLEHDKERRMGVASDLEAVVAVRAGEGGARTARGEREGSVFHGIPIGGDHIK